MAGDTGGDKFFLGHVGVENLVVILGKIQQACMIMRLPACDGSIGSRFQIRNFACQKYFSICGEWITPCRS